jgi:phosphate transport system ATP-binding protein
MNAGRVVEIGDTETVFSDTEESTDLRIRAGTLRMTEEPAPDRFALRTRALNLWYDDFHALKNVSTDMRGGCITALIGPSGCGKSTLLRCFNRLNERQPRVKTTGEVRVLGEDVYDADVSLGELRRVVGMVFQRPNPLPISIYENVVFGRALGGSRCGTSAA